MLRTRAARSTLLSVRLRLSGRRTRMSASRSYTDCTRLSWRAPMITKTMVEEYGGVVQFAGPIVRAGAEVFLAAEKALEQLPLTRSWGKTTVSMEPVGIAGLISPWN